MRDGFHYENKTFFVVTGIRMICYCEILGVRLADSGYSMFWEDLFDGLNERFMIDVRLVFSD
jgi:transposase-like protein